MNYKLLQYLTFECENLYAPVIERYLSFLTNSSKSGMIIPHSSVCTDRMSNLIAILKKQGLWLSSYDIRLSQLFDGVNQRLLIYITSNNSTDTYTSNYHRWASECREYLFDMVQYVRNFKTEVPNSIIKASRQIEKQIHDKCVTNKPLSFQIRQSGTPIYFHNAPRYFIRAMKNEPYFWNEKDGEKTSLHVKSISFNTKNDSYAIGSILNSTLFYWHFILFSNCRDFVNREIEYFRFTGRKDIVDLLSDLFIKLDKDFEKNKYRKETFYKATGKVIYDEFYPKLSKSIIDQIDCLLAQHYGFTHEELDFIINYDIKYRMGKELDSGEEGE